MKDIYAEVYLIPKVNFHIKYILLWKNKEGTLYKLFKNKKQNQKIGVERINKIW